MPFIDSLDIGNRALQHCGLNPILSVGEDSTNYGEIANAYDKVRRPELRRNVWRFSVRKTALRAVDTTTLLLAPPLYDETATYLPGAIVKDGNGLFWESQKPENTGNDPGGNNDYWDRYFGPSTISLYDSTVSYYAGEMVYVAGSSGVYQVYRSLISSNDDTPGTADAWDATVEYYAGQTVSYSGSQWRSLIPYNLNNTPADGAAAWSASTTYGSGDQVTGTNGRVYESALNGNLDNDPLADDGTNWTDTGTVTPWSRTPTVPVASTQWLSLGSNAAAALVVLYPLGSGPSSQDSTRNVFRLPCGYLRTAPQDPKAGSQSLLGAPTGLAYDDWNYDGDYIVSSDSDVILLRFVADVTKVAAMDDMFCEGLACRVATAVCMRLTQSNEKLQTIASEYKYFMAEARLVNAIEQGPVEPPIDDFLAVRY